MRAGQAAPKSGQYEEIARAVRPKGNEVTMPKGHTLPPTSQPGNGYKLVDPSKNNSGR